MLFNQKLTEVLQGDSHSDGLKIDISGEEDTALTRLQVIESTVRDKDIIHVGFVDTHSSIEHKLGQNTWLHANLCKITNRCAGVDTDEAGVDFVRNKLRYSDVYTIDLGITDLGPLADQSWDYLLLGEVLEHIDNPVAFLKSISSRCSKIVSKIIITVPNGFALYNFLGALKGIELINTDHRYWFTPYTLAKVVTQAGLVPLSLRYAYDYHNEMYLKKNRIRERVWSHLIKKYPALRGNLVLIAALGDT